ncbi:hypothetical protein G7B40_012165 [Aetokthonos hydrillicola Thurmond2011]|jgi:hypothetical protein|uniref:Uncharacterized protein n=1 Tax=Aetokthonos hydrillicola Thurmond2011 TaxID=2712845 RepID=A0AAP5I5R5_9CYAN|nr:hypothetical protein [Aetokthonos hydrillicola]MBO3459059.1 hypothetical protein [Aetokthonos hydrillicola CCALA 1050]MBW4584769.1 hypothetical protein [Aetokthonos hydrillicola CCALA 1050]MDR9895316.1 hypothetical protein [Aetokthonos hydrillicola Thurmond2011]
MKAGTLFVVVPVVLLMSLLLTNESLAQTHEVRINRNFQPDPIVINGKSGGTRPTKCGNISPGASQVIEVTDSIPYLRLTVESGGKPTILIDGPGGRFCVLPDQYSQDKPEFSGFWQAGKYSVSVGNLSEGQYTYTISISQQKK